MDPTKAPRAADALSVTPHPDVTCVYCGHTGTQVEMHTRWVAKDIRKGGADNMFSLAGVCDKTTARAEGWLYMRCLGCNHVSEGRR